MTSIDQYCFNPDSPTANHPVIITDHGSLTYTEFFIAVSKAEERLRNAGVYAGNRIGILSQNSTHYLIVLFALWRIGAVAALLSTRLPDEAVEEQLKAIDCQHVLRSDDLENISQASSSASKDVGGTVFIPLEQDATISFTSGTSSKPKAVLHTFSNHYYSARGANEHIPIVAGDQWLLSLPLYHVGGLGIILRAFIGGGSIVIPGPDAAIEDALCKHKISHLSLVPTQLNRLLHNSKNHDALKKLKAILLGGAVIPHDLIDKAIEMNLPLFTTYGSTEMASQIATSTRLSFNNRISAGNILNYRRLMLSEEGEILVKGETLFSGYVDHNELSRPFNKNGFFETRDMGEFSNSGQLIVTGRKDNMFISGGENIQPEEIESTLSQITSIGRAVVIPVQDPEFGFSPAAVIKMNKGCLFETSEITAFLCRTLPKFKVPKLFFPWPDSIKSDTAKINRKELAQSILP